MSLSPGRIDRLAEVLANMVNSALAWEAQHAASDPHLEIFSEGLTGGRRPVHNGATDEPMGQGGWDGDLTET